MELSYSFHLGNDSNKTIKARREAKNNLSGTTNKSNNAIQNVRQLGKVNHHNLRLYDNKQELIKTIKGSNDITKDVKELYLDLFDEARIEYNNRQTRDDRKIDNYFNKISNDTKHDLACEIVIELGDMVYWDDKSLEYKYQMTHVFEQQLEDLKEIVPDFYVANATIHFDEHSPHLHIVGVPVKENCKTGLSRQVGKTSIFTKESLVVFQDKMRERCIDEFNIAYGMDSKLKEKQKGKNRDITPFERKVYNEKVKVLKQEISNLENEVSYLEDNKESINKQITKLNKDKNDISDEIDKKKKLNNKIVLKSKNKMQDEINKLTEENIHLKFENKQYKEKYEELEGKTNYLVDHLNKVFEKLPEFIQKIVEKLFNNKILSLFAFKHDYDPEERKVNQEFVRKHNLFNKREIEKATKHLNNEMDEATEEFYKHKKEKDNGLER
ncbi:MAG TPA: plasmid recombination protein [Candidatus Onthousia faecigallinarum]|nr:plasmid recombination protein [Candidatus Onthousia faecigallinarum]